MMQLQKHHALQILTLCAALTLSACGGGSSNSAAETPAAATPAPAAAPAAAAPTPTAAECPFGDYQSAVVSLVNAYRASPQVCGAAAFPAVGALSWNGALAYAAEVHSNDMAINNYFDHPDANGVRIGGRASAAGYSYGSVGENIAGGQTSASQVVAAWMASESHCKNIMTASFYDIGVSCKTTSTSTYTYYWTLTMGNH